MKSIQLKRIFIFLLFLPAFFLSAQAQELTAIEIIRKSDEKSRGLSSQGTMTMQIIRPKWERSVSMKSWSKGTDFSLIYITSPAREKGQVFLKRETEMWNWVPSIERMIKIPPSMMMQSWMGSDFTNDDLVKESSIVKDYDHKLLGKETIREQECYKLELIPKPDAPVVWGKIISWVTCKGFDLWMAEYYDEDGYRVNTQHAYDMKQMGDRVIPTRLEMIPDDKPGNKTIFTFDEIIFDQPIKESFFSQQNMKRIK